MKLQEIANQLLDLGKRNRLLNYKETGLKSVDVLNHNLKEIYELATEGKDISFLLIDPLLERYHKTLTNVLEQDQDIVSEYTALKVYDITHTACKSNQIIAYKKGYKLDKILKALFKEYKYSITEKGINSLYLTFGFVRYTEDKIEYKAPLLLIPVDLSKNASGVYKIHAAEDDIILNPTLEYYFKNFRRFQLPQYNEEDFEFDSYMEKIKKVLPSNVQYEVGMSLGIYSFLKMNMYRDLTDHDKKVLKNRNIQSLLGNPSFTEVELQGKALPVVNCDSSQLKAIEMAVSGKSFCLQGPPGSGKSQTITNIIASLIGNERHVLFVSEKLQALQVVYENLKRAGLEEFAIELHSSKANKKVFIDNLYKTATLPKYSVSNLAEDTKEQHSIVKSFISSYVNALSAMVPNEKITVYELFGMYVEAKGEEISYRIPDIEKHPLNEISIIERILREYQVHMEPIGYSYKDCVFYGFEEATKEYATYELEKEFTSGMEYLKRLIDYQKKIGNLVSMDTKKRKLLTIEDLYRTFDFITEYNRIENPLDCYLDKEKNAYLIEKIEAYLNLSTNHDTLSKYDKEILNEDLARYCRKLKSFTGAFKIFNGEYRSLKRDILSYRNGKAKDNVLIQELQELIEIKDTLLKRKDIRASIAEYIPTISNESMKSTLEDLRKLSPFCGMSLTKSKDQCMNTLLDTMLSFRNYQDGDILYRQLASRFDGNVLDFYKTPMSVVYSRITEIYKMRNQLGAYILALQSIEQLKKLGYVEFLDMYLKENKPLLEIDQCFRKTYLKNKVFEVLHAEPIFEGFSSAMFKERVHEFENLDEMILKLNRDYIISVNSMKRPDDVLLEGSEFKILAKEANKIRRQKPVRVLLSEIFDLALNIKPVFLMSPLSVSTYLTEDNEFDCVIFDEASQIFSQDAFGAIYRGKQCIIIGDSKQMPPSNFFGASSEMDEDEENYDGGLESILDMGAATLSSLSLKWHYRSRSEELISFSNKEFYDQSLITIPQARKHEKGFGIDFEYLENGRYDAKTRTNRIEAERISQMVIEHYLSSDKSLGVVAFSKVQADLIEDLVEKEVLKYPELKKYFTDEVEEPFFVKNLETVQGDERDCIIFSICYGYNNDGKFYQRFGPLNNLGGERRLNVAITRSKYNIKVVSSIHFSDIKENSESLGAKLLRDYLEFAENVEGKKNSSPSEDGITKAIENYLLDLGYEVITNYGTSSFRIPLAVKEKGMDSFKYAIVIDKKEKNRNITDSYRLEKLLLERQGWKYYKIFTAAWMNDSEYEKNRLITFLNNSDEEESEITEDKPIFIEETEVSLESKFIDYSAYSMPELQRIYEDMGLEKALYTMIEYEQPINKDYLYRRAATILGKTKVSNVVKNEVSKAMPEDLIVNTNTIWVNKTDNLTLRIHSDRMMNEIPIEELMEGLFTIISFSNGITVDGAYRSLLKLLGFSRLTENTKKLLNDAVVFLKLDGRIIQKGECLYI